MVDTRRVRGVDTTSYYVEILNFRYFYRHCVFVEKDGFERQKVIKDYINISVVINLVWVDTRNWLSPFGLVAGWEKRVFLAGFSISPKR